MRVKWTDVQARQLPLGHPDAERIMKVGSSSGRGLVPTVEYYLEMEVAKRKVSSRPILQLIANPGEITIAEARQIAQRRAQQYEAACAGMEPKDAAAVLIKMVEADSA